MCVTLDNVMHTVLTGFTRPNRRLEVADSDDLESIAR